MGSMREARTAGRNPAARVVAARAAAATTQAQTVNTSVQANTEAVTAMRRVEIFMMYCFPQKRRDRCAPHA